MSGGSPHANPLSLDPRRLGRGNRILLTTLAALGLLIVLGLALGAPSDDGPNFSDVLYTMGLAGIVGFGTNWIAIRMLFHPYERTFGVQGVIPRKRAELSRRAALLMEERLISGHRLIDFLKRNGAISKIAEALQGKVNDDVDSDAFRERAREVAAQALCQASPTLVAHLRGIIEGKVKELAGPFASFATGMIGKLSDSIEAKLADPEFVKELLIKANVDFSAA
ncbi:MAG: DUF445 family protein, partial [Planctomycetes bacterium]|nr:DUF445 family protein [Planctomycetota bacterium]